MKVAVIGAGASGLMAAYAAASNGNDVTVYEHNEKCGKKIYITGKGRCNVTNAVPPQEFLSHVVHGEKFLRSAIFSFPPERLMQLLEDCGLKLKIERGNRVYPQSDKASDVTRCLENACKNVGVKFIFNAEISKIGVLNSTMSDIIVNNSVKKYDYCTVCTGGISYPTTGSKGDGYRFARETGHKIVEPRPALCGVNLKGNFYEKLQGLTLKNVKLTANYCGKTVFCEMGELLFTHFGVSGPLVLSLSSLINRLDLSKLKVGIDLKPALSAEQLDARLLRDFNESPNKSISTVLKLLLPNSLIPEVLSRAKIDGDKKINAISRLERSSILTILKSFDIIVTALRGFDEAVVTSGGVSLDQINPKTMESKLVKGLYFCGEVLDVDAFTGGFNLQIAFSTGFAAGNSIKNC